jgi:hypothetical protein
MVNPCRDVTKTSDKKCIQDGGHLITSSENISRTIKQNMKNSFKSSFKCENKDLYCHFPLSSVRYSIAKDKK